MVDANQRNIDYMRISITDRCNLRCSYCMPEGIKCVPMDEILTYEEILQIAKAGVELGITKFKITGGEPLVRRGCEEFIKKLKAIPGVEWVSVTTNGILLKDKLQTLKEAELDAINVSLDTTDSRLYKKITGYDGCKTVMDSIYSAEAMGFKVKVNAVSADFDGGDMCNAMELIEIARNHNIDVRFIEIMPIGYGKTINGISNEKIKKMIESRVAGLAKDDRVHGAGPAVYYNIPGFKGSVGFISAMHGKFCTSCNRVRLTTKGFFKTCLCYDSGTELKEIIRREGLNGEEKERALKAAMMECIFNKPSSHCFENIEKITEGNDMVSIGG